MNAKINVLQEDITTLTIDAIVNAANTSLLGGGGVDGSIHRAAGSQLLNECRLLGGCQTGEAKITGGYNLKAKHVIHTVGPIWHGGNQGERDLLKQAYYNSLQAAVENKIKSIAFPNISTGIYGFPKEDAASIAVATTSEFLKKDTTIELLYFVCFDNQNYQIYKKLLDE